MDFGGNTHDLGSIGEETDKTTNSTPKSLEEFRTVPGDGVAKIHDGVRLNKGRRQDFHDISKFFPIVTGFVRDVYVFVGSSTYATNFVVLEYIEEFIMIDITDVVMGRPFRAITQLEYDYVKGQPIIDESLEVEEQTLLETLLNITTENKAHYDAEKEAIHLILTGIGDDIYSTVDACKTAHDIWVAIERHKGKEIAKPIIPPYESTSKEDSDPEQAHRDKDMQKNFALITKYFKKLYKPTNNNLRTSSNSKNKNVDTIPRYVNENQTGQFRNQRTVTISRARKIVGSLVVQQTGIHCFNYKEFWHFSKECRKPKRTKDYTYHKEKMLLCKQAVKDVLLQAEQADWLEDMDEEIDEQELEAHYSFMEKIQEVLPPDLGSDDEPLEKVHYNIDYNVFANERQHSEQPASINNTYVVEKDDSNIISDSSNMHDNDNQADKNAKECNDDRVIQKQLKKANASLTHELKECKSVLEETNQTLRESNKTPDGYLVALHDNEVELANIWMAFGGNTCDLGSDGEETDKTTNSTPKSLEEFHTVPGDGIAKTYDDIRLNKGRRQDFHDGLPFDYSAFRYGEREPIYTRSTKHSHLGQPSNDFAKSHDMIEIYDFKSDDRSSDTPLVSPFLDADNESDDGEVLNELDEYGNAGIFYRSRIINSFDGEDLF
ncbi:hypothetical protein Tco_0027029 [Tanacetum coccineum]